MFYKSASGLSYKIYMTVGATLGVARDFTVNHWEDVLLTAILGFVGALFAGLAKLLIDKMKGRHTDKD